MMNLSDRADRVRIDGAPRQPTRPQLHSLLKVMGELRTLSNTMPIGEAYMFLAVALNEGACLTELAEVADMKKSTASRYLLDLSDKTRDGKPGYGLVNRDIDPNELRRNMYSLSPKGRKLLQQLATLSGA